MKIARALTHLGRVSAQLLVPWTQGRVAVRGVLGLRWEQGWAKGGLGALGAPPDSEAGTHSQYWAGLYAFWFFPFMPFLFWKGFLFLDNLSWGAVVQAIYF